MARSVRAEAMVEAVERSVRPRMKGKDAAALAVTEQCTVIFLPFNDASYPLKYLFSKYSASVFCRSYHRNSSMKKYALNKSYESIKRICWAEVVLMLRSSID